MERSRKVKFIIMITLMVAISAMSLGFAAFSATLNISSSANVSPNSSDFEVRFFSTMGGLLGEYPIIPSSSDNAYGDLAWVGDSTGSSTVGFSVGFTEPGQTVVYEFFIGNKGEYDAYLRAINFANVNGTSQNVVCTPEDGTTASLVDAACDAITMIVDVNGSIATGSNPYVFGNVVPKGEYVPIKVTLEYNSTGARVDGPFSVEFGGISLDFSTVDGAKIISFTVEGTTYQVEEGMTWGDFINELGDYSSFNYDGIDYVSVCYGYSKIVDSNNNVVKKNNLISAGEIYYISARDLCNPW